MSDAKRDRDEAATLPDNDILAILLRQHADIREMMARVLEGDGPSRRKRFAELQDFLVAHEKAEQEILRPVTRGTAGPDVTDARMREETEAAGVLTHLQHLDVDSDAFVEDFAAFEKAVTMHAEAEEHEEFPSVRAGRSPAERVELGQAFLQTMRSGL
jgi:hemerythrin superfamily protein